MWNLQNNTLFQLGGHQHAKSTPGMLQDVFIFKNIAFDELGVRKLMEAKPPRSSPMLKRLMRVLGVHPLDDICLAPDWELNPYRQFAWGLCPTVVCGPVSLNEWFLTYGWTRPHRLSRRQAADPHAVPISMPHATAAEDTALSHATALDSFDPNIDTDTDTYTHIHTNDNTARDAGPDKAPGPGTGEGTGTGLADGYSDEYDDYYSYTSADFDEEELEGRDEGPDLDAVNLDNYSEDELLDLYASIEAAEKLEYDYLNGDAEMGDAYDGRSPVLTQY